MEANTEAILQKLKHAGYKFTEVRKETVDLFVRNKNKYLSAKSVYQQVKTRQPTVSYDTVYRTLATLVEESVLEPREYSGDAVQYRLKCDEKHHHHLVCLGCGDAFPIPECPMNGLISTINDFQVVNHRFEVYGYCKSCQAVS